MTDTLFFVSKRLQRAVAAVICLMLAQTVLIVAAHAPQTAPTSVTVPIRP